MAMTMIRCRGTILLFVAFVAALDSSAAAATAVTMITDYEELLAKLNRLEGVFQQQTDRFENEIAEARGRIVHLEQQNEKLIGDFSTAKEKIASLDGKLQTLSGLLLRQPAPPINRHRPEAAGGVNDNSQPMTENGDHQLSFGDDLHQQDENRAIVTPPPTSCADLAQLGNRISGFHLVLDKESNNRIQTVYCDFALAFNNPDYETAIGYNDIKTSSGASFYVKRNSTYSSVNTVIPWTLEQLNVGGHMNAATGVFTAPVNGRYYFSFTARSWSSGNNWVYLRLNGLKIGTSYAPAIDFSMPQVATLQLTKGDTVDVYLLQGSIADTNDHYTQFTGFLLEEDLALLP